MRQRGAKSLFPALFLVLVNGWWCCEGCLEQEKFALLELKAYINYPNGLSLPSWGDQETLDCCKWLGVECDTATGRVIQLSLNYTRDWRLGDWFVNASKFLPFQELRILQLPYNSVVGCLQSEGFQRLSRLRNLGKLDLSGNKLSNSILSSLSGLSSLKYLNVASNHFSRFIHIQDLVNLISLKELDASSNTISGFIPTKGLKQLPASSSLEVLNLQSNLCDNTVLSSLNGLLSLKYINLESNQLKGSINIKELEGFKNLEELDISSNGVNNFLVPEGSRRVSQIKVLQLDNVKFNASNLLQTLGAFPSLQKLYFQNSNFEGKLTLQDMYNHSNLEELIMDYSSLNENFLQSIGGFTSLKVLSLFGCRLKGTLPNQGWCELTTLQELDFGENELEGILPPCLGNLTSLQALDLSSNQLTGNIMSSPLPTMTSLESISLLNNSFHLPISFRPFSNYSKLKVLLADGNNLVPDQMLERWLPRFQLKLFTLSKCTTNELNMETPDFLQHQHDLRIIDLSGNKFQGIFPFRLLENNSRLKELNLRDNSFIGPFQLPSHPNPEIMRFDISENQIPGQLPVNLSSIFPNIRILNMSRNMFEGHIPSSFGEMRTLWAMDLSNNNLSGEIPNQLAMGCLSLVFLKLSNNKLEGQISPQVINLPKLQCLYLNGNSFSGHIPDSLSTVNLLVLDISNNQLSGKLPRWIGNMSGTSEIVLSNNHLEGHIPVEFCKLDSLLFLDLSVNYLSGSIPSCFNPSNIQHVHLYTNRLTGPMTRSFSQSTSLVTLDLRDNYLSGKIPKWLGSLPMLSILVLRANQFEGEIPHELCQLSHLRMLDLSHNKLSGQLPGCLSNIRFEAADENLILSGECIGTTIIEGLYSYSERKKLMQLEQYTNEEKYPLLDVRQQVDFTTKSRSYTYEGGMLNFMSGIDLSCNELMGEIPPELGNLSEVHALNFSHNNLSGPIPTTFPKLRKIESLDLSYNILTGRIPSQLVELNSLAVFSVAHNNLSGEVPLQKAQFATFDESSYMENPLLCGPPLHNSCSKDGSPPVAPELHHSEEDNEFMDTEVFYLSFAVSYVTAVLAIAAIFYINPYWRRAWFYYGQEFIYLIIYFVEDNIYYRFYKRNIKTVLERSKFLVLMLMFLWLLLTR